MDEAVTYIIKRARGPRIGRDGLTMAERWERMTGAERREHMAQPPCPKCGPTRGGGTFEDGLCAYHWDGPTRDPHTGEVK
jgi:hypothetical protein